ncbi:MAG TPA: response regulator [Polyangiaceae bacterium]
MTVDRYRYFRVEAQELLEQLSQGALGLERGAETESVQRLLRLAHTLKGAARVVKLNHIGDIAHKLEDLLVPFRKQPGPMGRDTVDALLGMLDEIRKLVPSAAEELPVDPGVIPARAAPAADNIESLRLNIAELDNLLENVVEAGVQVEVLRSHEQGLGALLERCDALLAELGTATAAGGGNGAGPFRLRQRAEQLRAELGPTRRLVGERSDPVQREITELRERISELRLVSASALFGDLERAVRDAAHSLGKSVTCEFDGGETRIDAHVLASLRGALLHVVRNAVAHGIEDPSRRAEMGKPATGVVSLSVERRGHRASFSCRDDGRGIDLAAVRDSALERGLLTASEAPQFTHRAAVALLLQGGVTTSGQVTQIAGRGVGLDVVRDTTLRLKGEIDIDTKTGQGTTVTLTVPLSLSALPALAVEAGDIRTLVPIYAVSKTVRLQPSDVSKTSEGETIVDNDKVIPLLSLARALGRPSVSRGARSSPSGRAGGGRTAVVVRSGAGSVALDVDRLLGVQTAVVRALPELASAGPAVSGAALDRMGNPQFLLSPAAVVRWSEQALPEPEAAPEAVRLPILVIDDSLTTRMLEQSILESAGYEVDLATSAEEALGKAAQRRYSLFIVDVEMPGMDGFQFVAQTRADPALREIPSILVTSRGDSEDRRRGKQAGARAYIVKREFTQETLLETIHRLIG